MEDLFPILYQSIDLTINLNNATVEGRTTLWMAVKEAENIDSYDKLNLNCRKCRIKKVQINGVPTSYVHVDPLSGDITGMVSTIKKELNVDGSATTTATTTTTAAIQSTNTPKVQNELYISEAVDLGYRAALEITQQGELEIQFPKHIPVCPDILPSLPTKINKSSRLIEIKSRRDKIAKIINALKDSYYDADNEYKRHPKVFTVTIDYILPPHSQEGLIFRQSTHTSEYMCMYTCSKAGVHVRDPHGVRCWVPCMDIPTQRPIFDITLTVPNGYSTQCSGQLIDIQPISPTQSSLLSSASSSSNTNIMRKYRYFTTTRIPASSLGIYVGKAEQYTVPLYRVVGKVWVTRGLMDSIYKNEVENATEKGKRRKNLQSETDGRYGKTLSSDSQSTTKRMKLNHDVSKTSPEKSLSYDANPVGDVNVKGDSEEGVSTGEDDDDEEDDDEDDEDDKQGIMRLYRDAVRHTTLGMDLATRVIHKHTQHRYEYYMYTQIFVPDLGEDYLSYDGFSLIDARFLITPEQIIQETSTHLIQLSAYISSWILSGSAVSINSHDCEFILYGLISAIIHDYCELVFGEDYATYRRQKAIDSVTMLEKMGYSYPLCESFLPESYERFLPYYKTYYENKATALFQMIYSRLGGIDAMSHLYQSLIKSPTFLTSSTLANLQKSQHKLSLLHPSYHTQEEQFSASLTYLGLMPSPGHTGSDPSQTPLYDRHSDLASPSYPYLMNMYSPQRSDTAASPNPYGYPSSSPNPYASSYITSSPNPYSGMSSPHIYGLPSAQSPNPYTHMHSSPNPYSHMQSSPNPYRSNHPTSWAEMRSPRSRGDSFDATKGDGHLLSRSNSIVEKDADSFAVPTAIPSTALKRQQSIASDTALSLSSVGEQIHEGIILSLDAFVSTIQMIAGTEAEIEDSFVDKFICDSGLALIRFGIFLGPKVEGRPQYMHLLTDYSPLKNGKVQSKVPVQTTGRGEVRVRIVEVRDDTITEPAMRLTPGVEETYQQQVFTKPGRRGGKRKNVNPIDESKFTPAQLAERMKAEEQKEAMKDCLDVARDRDEPVRYALIDPTCTTVLGEVNNISSDAALVEQLYAEIDDKDVLRHIQALRSLARVTPLSYPAAISTYVTNRTVGGTVLNRLDLRLRAIVDCLLANPIAGNPPRVVNSGHCIYTRIEAAYALAQWQNERAPNHIEIRMPASTSSSAEDATVSLGQKEQVQMMTIMNDDWLGLSKLIEALHELYLDSQTILPIDCDWTQESEIQLRCAMLLALSTIKAMNYLTPIPVINTLLLFSENHVNRPVHYQGNRNMNSSEGDVEVDSRKRSKLLTFDDTHYVSTLMMALRNIRVDTLNKRDSTDPIRRVTEYALTNMRTDLAVAKAKSNVMRQHESDYCYPILPLGGMLTAAAITCIGEMDIQALSISDKDKKPTAGTTGFIVLGTCEIIQRIGEKVIKLYAPEGLGFLTHLRYTDFFIPSSHKLTYTKAVVDIPTYISSSDSSSLHQAYNYANDFHLYTWAVKLSALEAYIRTCLTQSILFADKMKRFLSKQQQQQQQQQQELQPQQSTQELPRPVYIPAILEVILYIIQNDPDRRVRRGAALCLLECIQDRPSGRVALSIMAHGDVYSTLDCYDIHGLTRIDPDCHVLRQSGRRNNSAFYRELFQKTDNTQMKMMVKSWWHTICHGIGDEVTRTLLYRTWVYVYGVSIPFCLTTTAADKKRNTDSAKTVVDMKYKLWGDELSSYLPRYRLTVRDPSECLYKNEMILRHGKSFKPVVHETKGSMINTSFTSSSSSSAANTSSTTAMSSNIGTTSNSSKVDNIATMTGTSSTQRTSTQKESNSGLRLSFSVRPT